MATEKDLRNEIRKHVQKMLKEYQPGGFLQSVGAQARTSLGSGRSMLDKYLGNVDTERLARLPKMQKVNLLAALMRTFGISANDLTSLRGQVSRTLKGYETAEAPVEEGKLNELDFENPPTDASTEPADSKVSSGLAAKGEKLKDTQAYKIMVKQLENKPASDQSAFVLDLLSNLPLDDSAKRMIKRKIKSSL